MKIAKGAFPALCLATALLGFAACGSEESADHFTLPNGVTLPVHEAAKLQAGCIVLGAKLPADADQVCLEFPMQPIWEGLDPLAWYQNLLIQKGFELESGNANQYRFNWPIEGGCYLRLNASALPKEYIQGNDWSDMKAYVAVFEFEDDERCR
ncbi:hypothetical protein RYZ27_01415 [Hyphomonas sp. FCG-A18]|uniref:hypothetical protein n=1 Tax=Hyphomonas sp. FCG-A18 TaxID=3080019 RepID=UPI002B324D75|nr:hypothetical protein RYZ27_01415 [Hyphomonas sp. FCG-A18]